VLLLAENISVSNIYGKNNSLMVKKSTSSCVEDYSAVLFENGQEEQETTDVDYGKSSFESLLLTYKPVVSSAQQLPHLNIQFQTQVLIFYLIDLPPPLFS
jgi:hypothetical protein